MNSPLPAATEGIRSPLMALPNELSDLNFLLRTTGFFHTLFNTRLYRRAVAASDPVREDIVQWVLSEYRLASLTLLLDNGLSVDQKLDTLYPKTLLRRICGLSDQKRTVSLARLLIERGADVEERISGFGTKARFY
jgi:hypothetical protein